MYKRHQVIDLQHYMAEEHMLAFRRKGRAIAKLLRRQYIYTLFFQTRSSPYIAPPNTRLCNPLPKCSS